MLLQRCGSPNPRPNLRPKMPRRHRLTSSEERRLRTLRDTAFVVQGGACYWCGVAMLPDAPDGHPQKLTGDHLVAAHEGGPVTQGNIVAACLHCNNSRHFGCAGPSVRRLGRGHLVCGDDAPRSPFAVLLNDR